MLNENLIKINKEHLERFIDLKIGENSNLEYKSQLNIDNGDLKKEFLEDISAFANSNGGHILFGIKEDKGVPVEICGIEIKDLDEFKLKLQNIINSSIKPTIDFSIGIIPVTDSLYVLIIQIYESFIGPHGVQSNGHYKFNRRIDGGRKPMDIEELRSSFVDGVSMLDKIKDYRLGRLQKIKSNSTPVDFSGNNILVIHIVPRQAYTSNNIINGELLRRIREDQNLWVKAIYSRGSGTMPEINFDGLYSWDGNFSTKTARCYVQTFRNGIIETAENLLLNRESIDSESTYKNELPSLAIEEHIYNFVTGVLKFYKDINIQPPFYVFISLLGVDGKTMASDKIHYHKSFIKERNLLLPEVIISNIEDDVKKSLKNVIDMIWNASGIDGSIYFDKDGNWSPKNL